MPHSLRRNRLWHEGRHDQTGRGRGPSRRYDDARAPSSSRSRQDSERACGAVNLMTEGRSATTCSLSQPTTTSTSRFYVNIHGLDPNFSKISSRSRDEVRSRKLKIDGASTCRSRATCGRKTQSQSTPVLAASGRAPGDFDAASSCSQIVATRSRASRRRRRESLPRTEKEIVFRCITGVRTTDAMKRLSAAPRSR